MKKKNDKQNKEILKENLLNSKIEFKYSYLIINLLNKGILESLVNKITNTKTKIYINTLIKKNYLTGTEQFLYLLNNFIYQFKENFYFLHTNSDYIIEILLQNDKYTNFLLCKKYIGNNEAINFFSYNIKRLIISGFYDNLKELSKYSETINQFAKDNNINIKKKIINCKDVDLIHDVLLKISLCNAKTLNNILLFEYFEQYIEQIAKNSKSTNEKIIFSVKQQYIASWENMIKNYYEKVNIVSILLK